MRSLAERKRDNIQRTWERLQKQAERALPGASAPWVAAAQRDLVACFAACRVPEDIAVRDALADAAGLIGGTLTEAAPACTWELPRHVQRARAQQPDLRRSTLTEIAIACRDIVRSAVQLADTQAVLRQALAARGNACLTSLQSAFSAAGVAVRITLFDVAKPDVPAISDEAAGEQPAQDAAVFWSDRYLHTPRDLQAGFLDTCRRAGLYLTDSALQMLSDESKHRFEATGPLDGRLVPFFFWRALRHQADRLHAHPDAIDALTGEDLMAAFDAPEHPRKQGEPT